MTLLRCCRALCKAPAIPPISSSGGDAPLLLSSLETFLSCFPARILASKLPLFSLAGGKDEVGGLASLEGGGGGPPERPPLATGGGRGGAGPPNKSTPDQIIMYR